MQIRALRAPDELSMASRLEATIWGSSESTPGALLTVFAHRGGIVLGAFEGEDQMVGLTVGFPGVDDTRVTYLHSHLLAVLPSFRGRHIGLSLKRSQWRWAKEQGYPYLGWTYDPLLEANAWFNLGVLGARVAALQDNVYGRLNDALNRDLPTHRFWVVWETNPASQESTPAAERVMPIPVDVAWLREKYADQAQHQFDRWFAEAQQWWTDGWRVAGVEKSAAGVQYRWTR